jgi:antitoxin ParD1/3/4
MGRTTSFVLGQELEEFVHEQVDSGAYASASEVVRDALTRLATERRKEVAVLRALDEGVKSGRAKPGVFNRVRGRVLKKRQ